jgi:hypothetical protein
MQTPEISIPDSDAAEFSRLPQASKAEYLAWKMEFATIAAGSGRLGDRIAQAGQRMGVSTTTARRKWDCGIRCGWRGVVDQRRPVRQAESAVPHETREFFRGLCEKHARSSRDAWKKLVALWHAGHPIPGYEDLPPADIHGLPRGWSYAQFMRHAPTKYELKSVRIGSMAADANRPLVLTTREGLEPGAIYMFDDLWHDHLVNFVGVSRTALRPLELACLDVASASKVAYGLRPRVRDEEGTNTGLKERDMRFLVAAVLANCGYRAAGTLLTVEHGTAAIRKDFEVAIDAVTGGAVRVARGGIRDASVVLGGWPGSKRGDFKLKAALESSHNLTHNALGLLPGNTGSNSRENKPENLGSMEAYNNRMLREVEKLPADRAVEILGQLELPLMHWTDYARAVGDIYRWIDRRTLHKLEGWERNGWTVTEFRLDTSEDRWMPAQNLRLLPEDRRQAALAVIERPGCMRVRMLSPAEVWQSGAKRLERLRPEHIPTLLGPDLAEKKRPGRHHCFTIESQEYGSETLTFPASRVRNALGQDVVLDPRQDYLVFANPFDTSALFICDMDMRYIGQARRQVAVSRADLDAIHKAIGEASHERAMLDAPIRARHAAEADERQAMMVHNDELLANARAADGTAETDTHGRADDVAMDYLTASAARAAVLSE